MAPDETGTLGGDSKNPRPSGRGQVKYGQFDNSTIATRGELRFAAPLPPGFEVSRKGMFTSVKADVETGDAEFDALFAVQAERPEEALRVLTSPVRSALVALGQQVPGVVLKRDSVSWRKFSAIYDAERLNATLDAMKRLAEALHISTQGLAESRAEAFTGVTLPERAEVEVAAPAPISGAASKTSRR